MADAQQGILVAKQSPEQPVEHLQGSFEKGVMDRVCRAGDGLFPAPEEIKLSCSCPDWADMCKHVAAALYGVGARFDRKPQLLFVLRGVDANELIAGAGSGLALPKAAEDAVRAVLRSSEFGRTDFGPAALSRAKVIDEGDVAAVFGLEMDDSAAAGTSEADAPLAAREPLRSKTRKAGRSQRSGKASASASQSSGAKSSGAKSFRSKSAAKVRVAVASPGGDRQHLSTIWPPS